MNKINDISKGVFLKKYVLSWLLPGVFFVIKNKIDSSFLTQALFLLSIIQGILYLGLKRVSYDNEKIYFSNKVYGFNKIENFYVFDQKISLFFV